MYILCLFSRFLKSKALSHHLMLVLYGLHVAQLLGTTVCLRSIHMLMDSPMNLTRYIK